MVKSWSTASPASNLTIDVCGLESLHVDDAVRNGSNYYIDADDETVQKLILHEHIA